MMLVTNFVYHYKNEVNMQIFDNNNLLGYIIFI